MADWLRPVFARTKTPIIGATVKPLSDRAASVSEDSNEPATDEINMSSRLKSSSRVSSYIGFRPNTPPALTIEAFSNLRNPENVYHKPSLDQMAETLKVVMMTQSTMDSVPILYNASILHLLEAYQDMRQQLNAKQEAINELRHSHENDITEFEALAMQWERKERDYKAEVKRLEIILSKTEGGMEAVAIARSKSSIHGSERASEEISRGIGTIKERQAAQNHQERELVERIRATYASPEFSKQAIPTYYQSKDTTTLKNNNPISQAIPPEKRSFTPFYSYILRSQAPRNSIRTPELLVQEEQLHSPNPSRQSPGLTRLQLEALEQQQTEEEFGAAFESSNSGADSSSESFLDQALGMDHHLGLGIGLHEGKPLPGISSTTMTEVPTPTYSMNDLLEPPNNKEFSTREHVTKQMSFSFQPGDDIHVLYQGEARDFNQRRLLEEHLRQRDAGQHFEALAQQYQPPKDAFDGEPKQLLPRDPHNTRKRGDKANSLTRDDSSGSVVTAVRDNSGRSSANSSRHNGSKNGRLGLDRKAGTGLESSEAVAAAARAYSARQRGGPNHSRPQDSRSPSRSQDETAKGETAKGETAKGETVQRKSNE